MTGQGPTNRMSIHGYEQFELLGSGGFSRVWKAYQARFSRHVAIKVLSFDIVDAKAIKSFERESQAMGKVSEHPNIVTVFDNGITDDDRPYIVMEYFQGGTYSDRLRSGPLSVEEVLRVGVKISGALATAHQAGILHRDLKPHNIFVSRYGEPALGDFGISTIDRERTSTGTGGLTVHYAPPEVLDGRPATIQSDIYSLGATFWALLQGTKPFVGDDESVVATAVRILNEPPRRISRTDCPPALRSLIEDMMSKDAAVRPVSATEVAQRLQVIERDLGLAVTNLVQERTAESVGLLEDAADRSGGSSAPTIARTQVRPEAEAESASNMTITRPTEPVPPTEPDELESGEPVETRRGRTSIAIGGGAIVLVAALAWWGFTASTTDDPQLPETTDAFVQEDDLFDFPVTPIGVAVLRLDTEEVEVGWDMGDAVEGDSFRIERVDANAPDDSRVTAAESPVVIEGVSPGDTPCFEVSMVRSGRISPPSATACAPAE